MDVTNATDKTLQQQIEQAMYDTNQLRVGAIVRLGPWTGRIVDILVSETTGERYGRVRFVKHAAGVTEVHPLGEFKPAALKQMRREVEARRAQIETAQKELLGQINGIGEKAVSSGVE
jgi:hypothetical protein